MSFGSKESGTLFPNNGSLVDVSKTQSTLTKIHHPSTMEAEHFPLHGVPVVFGGCTDGSVAIRLRKEKNSDLGSNRMHM
jgi:hypothetical protein